jgi:predicted GTPase
MRIIHSLIGTTEEQIEDEDEFDEDGILIEYEEEDEPTIYEIDEEDEEFDEEDELLLDDIKPTIVQAGTIPIAIIGRPNVGKSTFINQVSHKELSKVSAIPGTTLDYISSEISIKEQDYVLYDTAGIRRK